MIDWHQVEQLNTDIGDDDFREVVALFLDEVEHGIASLHSLETSEDLANCLHFLKGSALNLGFRQFSQLCAEGERLAATGSMDVGLDPIINSFSQSKSIFTQQLADHMAA